MALRRKKKTEFQKHSPEQKKAETGAESNPKPAEGSAAPEDILPEKKKKRIPLFFRILFKFFGFLFVGIAAAGVFLVTANVIDNDSFETTFYRMSSMKIENPMRIVVLSDLHCKEFGPRNADLIAEIVRLEPDMIAMVGDMMNEYQEDYSVIINLLNDLQELKIAPIFYSYGNHEKNTWYNINEKLDADIKATGVHVYSDSFDTTQINGNTIVVGGLTTPTEYYYTWWASNFMAKFVAQDSFKLLLSHYPDYFLTIFNAANPLDADLALCGHTHGGLIRIPGFGAVYGPDQGFRPKLTEGIKNVGGCTVVVSRGLGGRVFPIRINNKPELVVVDIE